MQECLLLREAGLGPFVNLLSSASEACERSISCCSNITHCPPYTLYGSFQVHFCLMKASAAPSVSSFCLIHLKALSMVETPSQVGGTHSLLRICFLQQSNCASHVRPKKISTNAPHKLGPSSCRITWGLLMPSQHSVKRKKVPPTLPPVPFPAPSQGKEAKFNPDTLFLPRSCAF